MRSSMTRTPSKPQLTPQEQQKLHLETAKKKANTCAVFMRRAMVFHLYKSSHKNRKKIFLKKH